MHSAALFFSILLLYNSFSRSIRALVKSMDGICMMGLAITGFSAFCGRA
ncbi:MAG: hypothetical protein NC048_08605 [Bacteroides sp.]|nr:hypothetical protein [Ruminococcus flavefaciens]MCM1555539.1 hypothetical protein [Bacteroides sp.]